MEFLYKYRPLKDLEFYQRKVLHFINSAESPEDIRSLLIPYGPLGFQSPVHFISCIPPDLCQGYLHHSLLDKAEKVLRKGNRVFLTTEDGTVQSVIFRDQRQNKLSGKQEAMVIRNGRIETWPLENITPYKGFLRSKLGSRLVEGEHKVVGTNVDFVQPTWDIGDYVFHKPSKRWAEIVAKYAIKEREYRRLRMEPMPTKKEKYLNVSLLHLQTNSVPLRIPYIPKNYANVKKDTEPKDKPNGKESQTPQKEEASTSTNSSIKQSTSSTNEKPSTPTSPSRKYNSTSNENNYSPNIIANTNTGKQSATNKDIVLLTSSPKSRKKTFQNEYSEAPTVTLRKKPSRASMRPLTEFFHSQSVDLVEDAAIEVANEPTNKSKSVNNLDANVSDDEYYSFENYRNSLRKKGKHVLEKQVSTDAGNVDNQKPSSYFSTTSNEKFVFPDNSQMISTANSKSHCELYATSSTSANDASDTDCLVPPLPKSAPPKPNPRPRSRSADVKEPFVLLPQQYYGEPSSLYENVYYGTNSGQVSLSSELSSSGPEANSLHSLSDISRQDPKPSFRNHSPQQILRASTSQPDILSQNQNNSGYINGILKNKYSNHYEIHQPVSSHYRPEKTRATSVSSTMKSNGSLPSRYKKNPTLTKTRDPVHKFLSTPSVVEEYAGTILPSPFTPKNIYSAIGKGRGVQSGHNSSYADVTVFALFYCTNAFDHLLTEDVHLDRGIKRDVKGILRHKIVKPLRISAFCSRENIGHLRECLLPLSSKLNSPFMDVEEFLHLLFENALNVSDFLKYSNNTQDIMHHIVVKPKDRTRCQDIQFLLETSLEINNLKFTDIPSPALMVCTPRCNGRLVYYDAVIPNITLNITKLLDKGPKRCLCDVAATLECSLCSEKYGEMALAYCMNCRRMAEQIHHHIGHTPHLRRILKRDTTMELHSVICAKNGRFSAFVKISPQKFSPWLYYEAMDSEHPEVVLLDNFSFLIRKLEQEPSRYRDMAKSNPYLKRLIVDSRVCLYYHVNDATQGKKNTEVESFRI